MEEEEGKAVEEVAKTTGKAIDAAREAGGFLAKYIQGSLEQGIGIFEDKLKYMRWERQVRLMQKADEFLKARGLTHPSRSVPMKIAIPIMQGGSLEENDYLQDYYARLLANAADTNSETEVRRAFISILEDLAPNDAKVLKKIYDVPAEEAKYGIRTIGLPDSVAVDNPETDKLWVPSSEMQVIIRNVLRLGLLDTAMMYGGGHHLGKVYQTQLGREFMMACGGIPTPPRTT